MRIHYLNTDLDLRSKDDLRPLARAFARKGVFALHVGLHEGNWFGSFETDASYRKPNSNIAAMLDIIERLGPKSRQIWRGCAKREFNVGYDCGNKPWAFNNGLSNRTLARMARADATLRITLYPPTPDFPAFDNALSPRP